MITAAITANATPIQPNDAHARKIVRAAHQFEGVLLNSLLGSLEHTFSTLPGDKPNQESETYQSMGMQTLAEALSQRGGIGIADRIVHSLQQSEGASQK